MTRSTLRPCEIDNETSKSNPRNREDPRFVNSISVFLVSGEDNELYSQNLCLLGKLFLDQKTLYFDVKGFEFFILTENNHKYNTKTIVGYFSREKNMSDDNNLACIMVLPPHQNRGYGNFLISLSYYLSGTISKRICTPEKPLSKMGQ